MEQYNNQNLEREFGWEDEIVVDGQEFIDIPDGEYDFLIESIDRNRYQGSAKIPACNQAKVTLIVEVPGIGPARISTYLMLYSKMDIDTMNEFGQWLETEGLQAIATRVSTGDECSIIIEDGYIKGQENVVPEVTEKPKWKAGEF